MDIYPRKSINIGNRTLSQESPAYIIAEMACAHQGDPEQAILLIDSAVDAGADAIQLELFDAPNNLAPQSPLYEKVCQLQFSEDTWKMLFKHSRDKGIDISAFVYDVPSFELAKCLDPDLYKLNSSDLSNPELLKLVATTGKPYTIGTGASSLDEISRSLKYLLSHGGDQVVLMHGVQNFPTPLKDADIGRIELLRHTFNTLVGYADHTSGDDPVSLNIDLIALGAGACLVEKHIVLNRSDKGVDSEAALEPDQLKSYIEQLRRVQMATGNRKPQDFTESCLKYRRFQKKITVAKVTIEKDEILDSSKIIFLRHPDTGISPFDIQEFIGKRVKRKLNAYEAITKSDIAD